MGRAWFFLAVWSFASLGAGTPVEGLSGKAKLDAVLKEISKAQLAVQTIQADFKQTKVSRLLKEPSVLQGVFYYQAPDKVRWEYRNPRETVVLVTAREMVTYRPSERLAEKVELGRNQRKLFAFLSASEPIANLSRHFSFALRDPGGAGNYVLVLTPVTHQLKKRLHHVELVIERKSFLPVTVSYTETDGDTTSYEFSQVKINQPLPATLFSLDLPPGVRVVELKLRGSE